MLIVSHFIAQHAPEIAYANPSLPFNITKLGKPLTKWGLRNTDAFASTPSIGKMRPNLPASGEESEGGEAAKDVRPVVHLKEDGTELKRGEKVPAEIVVNFRKSSYALGLSIMRLRKRRIDADTLTDSKAAETISIKGGARWTILKRLLDTIDVKPPQKLLEKLPALQIEAPEGLSAEEVGTTTVEEQPTSSQTITA